MYLARTLDDSVAVLQEPEALLALGWFSPDALPTPLTLSARQGLARLSAAG
ncbi:hypothetical protein D3C81_2317510 [compost metagenome]